MLGGILVLSTLAIVLFALAWWRKPESLAPAMRSARNQIVLMSVRLPLALLSAAFIATLVPAEAVAPYIGAESGWLGILIAGLFGAVIPGGPVLTFPLALVIWRSGAGAPQMVALLASWSIFAMHRVISYELPMLGGRFVLLRLASAWMLPFLAGALAFALMALWG